MAATKYIKACRHGQEVQLFFRPNVRMGTKCAQSDFDRGMITVTYSWFEYLRNCWFSCITVSRVCREWCKKQKTSSKQQFCRQKPILNERGQRRRARLVKADRKVLVQQWYGEEHLWSHNVSNKSIKVLSECMSHLYFMQIKHTELSWIERGWERERVREKLESFIINNCLNQVQ